MNVIFFFIVKGASDVWNKTKTDTTCNNLQAPTLAKVKDYGTQRMYISVVTITLRLTLTLPCLALPCPWCDLGLVLVLGACRPATFWHAWSERSESCGRKVSSTSISAVGRCERSTSQSSGASLVPRWLASSKLRWSVFLFSLSFCLCLSLSLCCFFVSSAKVRILLWDIRVVSTQS